MTTTNEQSSREQELRGLLREWQQAGNGEPNPNGILLGGHLDSFVDAELAAMKLPPTPAQSGGQG